MFENQSNIIKQLDCHIIKDADKLDIITHVITEYDFESVFWYKEFNCDKINEELIKIMFENQSKIIKQLASQINKDKKV